MTLNYNAPIDGVKSTIDAPDSDQMVNFMYLRKAIIHTAKEQYFMPLADTISMPKNVGKTVKVYEYVPLLDDDNVNDQGIDANGATIVDGNLYGSSRDIGKITSKLPTLTENGGRVNRVGFRRIQREGSIHNFGFFYEFTEDSLQFDSDEQLKERLANEAMKGAVQLTEAVLQKDLLAAAGTVLYAGGVLADEDITGEVVGGVPASIVTYENLMRLDGILNDNRTPKQTTIITGSRLIDTKTIPTSRVMYIGHELVPLIRRMEDLFGNQAFIPVQQYGDAGTIINGEIGSVDSFRIVVVPEMLHWAGAGAEVDDNPGYRSSMVGGEEHYDIYPMLVVGEQSFTTIGFQTSGKALKMNVITKMPGAATADRNEPFGKTGFSSIQWWYGILILRPERIALVKTVAPI